jgi:hypothetical protein
MQPGEVWSEELIRDLSLCLIQRGILEVSGAGNSLMNRTESSHVGLIAAASNWIAVRRWDWPVPEVGRVKGSRNSLERGS